MGQYSKRGPNYLENVQKLNRKFIKTLSVHSKKQLLRFKKMAIKTTFQIT